ncbi:unnamed protein product [Macrosiphum euphorbiae]|uniref:Uncharacterized protein n=1 Tax=Macrosiphum euphorbiae TaxID=13131 RepID=A0AAV0W2Q5_9HEMI|nr:unnamed protein product [Macrosiphum euphorbiae]
MAGNCFICENSLSVGETVNVERGLQTLKNASNERDDGHLEFLNNVTSVTVHVECRKDKKKIASFKSIEYIEMPYQNKYYELCEAKHVGFGFQ